MLRINCSGWHQNIHRYLSTTLHQTVRYKVLPSWWYFAVFMSCVAWKRALPRKFARFVRFRPIKKRSFNLSCVLEGRIGMYGREEGRIVGWKDKGEDGRKKDRKAVSEDKNMTLTSLGSNSCITWSKFSMPRPVMAPANSVGEAHFRPSSTDTVFRGKRMWKKSGTN